MGAGSNDISDLDLQALADNALSPEERSALMERVQKSPEAQERLDDLLHQKKSIKAWWKNKPQN